MTKYFFSLHCFSLVSSSCFFFVFLFLLLSVQTIIHASYRDLGIGTLIGELACFYYDPSRDAVLMSTQSKHIIVRMPISTPSFDIVAGTSGTTGTIDSQPSQYKGTSALFNKPYGITGVFTPASPRLTTHYIIADETNNCIRRMKAFGNYQVDTVAGICGQGNDFAEGAGNVARFATPGNVDFFFKTGFIIIGQHDYHCVLLAKPSGPSGDPYSQLTISRIAGVCDSTAGTSVVANPLQCIFTSPKYVVAAANQIAYFSEKAGQLFRLNPVGGNPATATINKLNNPVTAGHLHSLISTPYFGSNTPLILFIGLHSGTSLMGTISRDNVLNNPSYQPTFQAPTCMSGTDVISWAVLPNGTVIQGMRGPDNNVGVWFGGLSCYQKVRPIDAFFGQLATKTRTIIPKTGSVSISNAESRTVSISSAVSESQTLSVSVVESNTITQGSPSLSNSPRSSLSETISSSQSMSLSISSVKSSSASLSSDASASITRSGNESTASVASTESPSHVATTSQQDTPSLTRSNTVIPTPTHSPLDSSSLSPPPSLSLSRNASSLSISLTVRPSSTHTKQRSRSISRPAPPTHRVKPVGALGDGPMNGAAVIAALMGSPGVAVVAAKLAAAAQLANCGSGNGLTDDMDWLANPFGAHFGSGILTSQRAAAFLNVYFLAIFAVVVLIAAWVMSVALKRSFAEALMRLRFPAIICIPLAIMQPGTSEAAAALWFYSTSMSDWALAVFATVTVLVGPLILIALVTLPGFNKAVLYKLKHEEDEFALNDDENKKKGYSSAEIELADGDSSAKFDRLMSNDEENSTSNDSINDRKSSTSAKAKWRIYKNKFVRAWFWLTTSKFEWFDQDKLPPTETRPDHLKAGYDERGEYCSKYGAAFEDYVRPHAVLIDMSGSIVLGWCAGVSSGKLSRSECLLWLSGCSLVALFHLYYFAFRHPVLTKIRLYFTSFASLITFLTIILATLQFLGEIVGFDVTAGYILDVQSAVGLVAAMIEVTAIVVFFAEVWDAYRSGRIRFGDDDDSSSGRHGQTFALDEGFLQELEDRINENNNANNNNNERESIDLSMLLSESNNNNNDDELINLDDLITNEEEEEEADIEFPTELQVVVPPENHQQPIYGLEDDDTLNVNSYLLDDVDNGSDGNNAGDDKNAIGKAERANMEQFMQLQKMLEKKQ